MYVKSLSVAMQALCIISIGTLADSDYWRKRLLLLFAFTGSLSAACFMVLPGQAATWLPVVAALVTLVGSVAYAASIVCANAFLPGLAREDPDVLAAKAEVDAEEVQVEGSGDGDEEGRDGEAQDEDDREQAPRISVEETRALLGTDAPNMHGARLRYAALLSRTMSRLSATGTAIGFFSGVAMLALLVVPVSLGKGSTSSLELTVGLSGLWWAVFTIPAALGLPGGTREPAPDHWLRRAWKHVAAMITPTKIRQLPNLFMYLLAWVFLSDGMSFTVYLTTGFHTTTYTAIIYASSTLHMSPNKVIVIGLLVQIAAVISSIAAPRIQARLGQSNLGLLLWIVLAANILPIYACLGLILPFGGLRTEAEMYIGAAFFGTVSLT